MKTSAVLLTTLLFLAVLLPEASAQLTFSSGWTKKRGGGKAINSCSAEEIGKLQTVFKDSLELMKKSMEDLDNCAADRLGEGVKRKKNLQDYSFSFGR